MEISRELYEAFDRFELDDLKHLNIVDRHIEQSEIYDIILADVPGQAGESAENEAIRKIALGRIYTAISMLPAPETPVSPYYFVGLTYEQIAEIEGCSFQAI